MDSPQINLENSQSQDNNLSLQRQKCEVYSRVSGYLRPVQEWNKGKQSEYHDRKMYKV